MTEIVLDTEELRTVSVVLRDAAADLTELAYRIGSSATCAGLPPETSALVEGNVSAARARLEQLAGDYQAWASELDLRGAIDQTGSTLAGVTATAYGAEAVTCCGGPVDVDVPDTTQLLPVTPAQSATGLAVQGASAVAAPMAMTPYGLVSTAPLPTGPPQLTAAQSAALPLPGPLSNEDWLTMRRAQGARARGEFVSNIPGVSIGAIASISGSATSQFISSSSPPGASPSYNPSTGMVQPLYAGNLTPGNSLSAPPLPPPTPAPAPPPPPPSVPSGQ